MAVTRWLVALPLAASLLLGIWLGAKGSGTSYFWNTTDDLTTLSDGSDLSTGIDDAETLSEEGVT